MSHDCSGLKSIFSAFVAFRSPVYSLIVEWSAAKIVWLLVCVMSNNSLIVANICFFPQLPLPSFFSISQLSHLTFTHTHRKLSDLWCEVIYPFSCPLPLSSPISVPLSHRAVVEKYLLEKSRLVSREKNERWGGTGWILTTYSYQTPWGPLYKHRDSLMNLHVHQP